MKQKPATPATEEAGWLFKFVRDPNLAVEWILPYRQPFIVVIHGVLIFLAYYLTFLLRFDFYLSPDGRKLFFETLPILLAMRLAAFAYWHLYEGLWRYVSMRDIQAILKAVTVSSVGFVLVAWGIYGLAFPIPVFVVDWTLCLALVGGVRLALRAVRESARRGQQATGKRTLIVGAGDGGEMLLREIERNLGLLYEVVGFVDDDPKKRGRRIHVVEVLGGVDDIAGLCRSLDIQEILIAIPSASAEERQRIIKRCEDSGVGFKSVPALNDLLQGRARIGNLHEVRAEDLLGRKAIRLDFNQLRQELQGERILVTGAAGSIGSELCLQVAAFKPEHLVLYDRAENGLYFLTLDLRCRYPDLRITAIVGDITNARKVEETVAAHAPEVIYHAAAYKHVPLMEEYPLEAMENNIFGTETVALAAQRCGVKKFVFISTDKAVKPVGIMGMSKRIAECLVLCSNGGPATYVAVRFGNVLGSDGSVLPLFRAQIARGGPVTVTDAGASRYFMLPSEAAQLVLQAGTLGKGGEVFFLDMGEPVRILDLAQNLIRLSGLEPGRDVPVEMIGLRPGERLEEELTMDKEDMASSGHEKVFIVKNHHFDASAFKQDVEVLRGLVAARDREGAVTQLRVMASRY